MSNPTTEERLAYLERQVARLIEGFRTATLAQGELIKDWQFRTQKRGVAKLIPNDKEPTQ